MHWMSPRNRPDNNPLKFQQISAAISLLFAKLFYFHGWIRALAWKFQHLHLHHRDVNACSFSLLCNGGAFWENQDCPHPVDSAQCDFSQEIDSNFDTRYEPRFMSTEAGPARACHCVTWALWAFVELNIGASAVVAAHPSPSQGRQLWIELTVCMCFCVWWITKYLATWEAV